MDDQPPSYRREFFKSPHHVWFGLATLGLGFLSAQPLFLLLGATAYVLGWIYLPDTAPFRRWCDRRRQAAKQAASVAQMGEFLRKRENLLSALTPSRRDRYRQLGEVCRGIEEASRDNPLTPGEPGADPRLRKLDELMWTFLRLLSIEESLERFLETERREDVPGLTREAEQEVTQLRAELEALKAASPNAAFEAKDRLLSSRQERLGVLRKRLERTTQARENLALVVSEQERLEQQIKLIRADAVATRNADALTARIDATVEHLDQTNKWLAEMDEFKDLSADLPPGEVRVGFDVPIPPMLDAAGARQPHRVLDRRTTRLEGR